MQTSSICLGTTLLLGSSSRLNGGNVIMLAEHGAGDRFAKQQD